MTNADNDLKPSVKRKKELSLQTQFKQAIEHQAICPLTFNPILQKYPWGGRNLETKLSRNLPAGLVAESWEIADHPSGPTQVNNGLLAGKTLPEIISLLGVNLVGSRSQARLKQGKFPLLVKLLDVNQPLVVQVHPTSIYIDTHLDGESGKARLWYILYARPGASLIYGLKPHVTQASFRQALQAGQPESCLSYLPVKAGDAVFVPAGTVHVILDGLVLVDIQQYSETTYRLYNWDQGGGHGQPHSLHLDKAMQAINFTQLEPEPGSPRLLETQPGLSRELIANCPHFWVEKVQLEPGAAFKGRCNGETFEIWGVMSGHSRVVYSNGVALELEAVGFTLLPAALGDFTIETGTSSILLRVYIPGSSPQLSHSYMSNEQQTAPQVYLDRIFGF